MSGKILHSTHSNSASSVIAPSESDTPNNFEKLFSRNVPHILEKIFLTLDYESYISCQLEVSNDWRRLLTSRRYITKAKLVFQSRILLDERMFVAYVKMNRKDLVRRLLSSGMVDVDSNKNINAEDDEAPLHAAVWSGHIEIAQILVQSGANLNLLDDSGLTPLCTAAFHKRVDIARLLIESGADANAKDKFGCTPLHTAAGNGCKEILLLLIENGAEVNVSRGNYYKNWDGIRYSGWDVGETPLHKAALKGRKDVAKLLIESGANLEAADKGLRTPLHYAAMGGSEDMVRYLIAKGAKANKADEDGRYPRDRAADRGFVHLAQLLSWAAIGMVAWASLA